nr:helix-turn-helix domain-containing protein [Gammaproteobacteria bacterium]
MKKIDKKKFTKATVRYHLTPGEALKTLRELQELTQQELASMTGMAQSHISAMENGSSSIGVDRALALAKILKVHPAV